MVVNRVWLTGEVVREPIHEYSVMGMNYYSLMIGSKRRSGVVDEIPVLMNLMPEGIEKGTYVSVTGAYQSRIYEGHMQLAVVADSVEICEPFEDDKNEIELSGHICKAPLFRVTPKGREITELMMAVNRPHRTDYIPMIAWERVAKLLLHYEMGESLYIRGRIQSRQYTKHFEDGTEETRTAYEVSIGCVVFGLYVE